MRELYRKTFHILVIPIWIPICLIFSKKITFFLFILVIFVNFLVVKRVKIFRPIYPLIYFLERERNLQRPAIQSLYANLSLFLVFLLFDQRTFIGSTLVLSLGDGFSTLIGYYFGKVRLPYNEKKTLEGSLSFLLSSFLALNFLYPTDLALLCSLICALVESLPLKVDDNFSVPLVASFVLSYNS